MNLKTSPKLTARVAKAEMERKLSPDNKEKPKDEKSTVSSETKAESKKNEGRLKPLEVLPCPRFN